MSAMDFHEKIQTNPITGLPDAVKALIISKLDRSSRLSLFQVSRVTRDLVFSHCTGIRYTCHTDCHEHELLFTSVARRASPVHLTLCENGGLGKLVRMAVTMGVQLHAVHSLKMAGSKHSWSWSARLHQVFPAVTHLRFGSSDNLSAADLAATALLRTLTHLHVPYFKQEGVMGLRELSSAPMLTSLTLEILGSGVLQHLPFLGANLTELRVMVICTSAKTADLFQAVASLRRLGKLSLPYTIHGALGVADIGQLAKGCPCLKELNLEITMTLDAFLGLVSIPTLTRLRVGHIIPDDSVFLTVPPAAIRERLAPRLQLLEFKGGLRWLDARVAARLPLGHIAKVTLVSLGLMVPRDLPADVAVSDLAAAATNLGCHCPGLQASHRLALSVCSPQAAHSTNLSHILRGLAPLAPHFTSFDLDGPSFDPEEDQDQDDLLPPPPSSGSDSDSEGDSAGVQGVQVPRILSLVVRPSHTEALAQALPHLKELSLSYCKVAPGVLPLLGAKMAHLETITLGSRVAGAVAAADLAAFCCTAPRAITVRINMGEEGRSEALAARHTLRWYHSVLGKLDIPVHEDRDVYDYDFDDEEEEEDLWDWNEQW